jgi:hypothetical protein
VKLKKALLAFIREFCEHLTVVFVVLRGMKEILLRISSTLKNAPLPLIN